MAKDIHQNPKSVSVKENHPFSADRPIEKISEDRLGRSLFSSKLAEAICSWNQDNSLILGLYGEWGTGKTSVKNLFKCHCESLGHSYFVEFNPWQWSAQEKIFEAFFQIIGDRLGKEDVSKESKQLAKKWKFFASSWEIGAEITKDIQKAALYLIMVATAAGWLSTIPNGITRIIGEIISITTLVLGGLVAVLPNLFKRLTQFFEAKAEYHQKDLEERRNDLIKELKKLKNPIVVIIDDIDRLNSSEIQLVIQLVKSNSNLPNIVFFLLFQKASIVKALDGITDQNGDKYLEKIIQVGFDMPTVPEYKLRTILVEDLNDIFSEIDFGNKWDKERWNSIFNNYLKLYFRTLRDVYRFSSTLRFHANIHKNGNVFEVNPIDLIAIEAIRVFDHSVYEKIKNSFNIYTDDILRTVYLHDQESEDIKIVLENIVEEIEEERKEKIKGLVIALFPQVGPTSISSPSDWDKDLRICHKSHFCKYFELALREQMISELEMSLVLKSAADANLFSNTIREYIKRKQLSELLDRLELNIEKMPVESASIGILHVSDEFPPHKPNGVFDFPPESKAFRILRNLLLRIPEDTRSDFMCRIFSSTSSIIMAARIVDAEDRQKRKDQLKEYLLKEDNLKSIQLVCVEKIKLAASDGTLLKLEPFLWLLECWKNWSRNEEAVNWVKSYVKDANSAMRMIMAAVSVSTVSSTKGTRQYDNLLLKWLEQFIDLEEVLNYVSGLDKKGLGEREQHVLKLFERGLKNKKEGKPYDQIYNQKELWDLN
jgi:predicted KAP-like P-loop ATPase